MLKKITILSVLVVSILSFNSCRDKDGTINIFSIEDDKKFGLQAKQEIENTPTEYPLLPETGGNNAAAYTYIRNIVSKIKASGSLNYKDEFAWEVKIIKDDNTLNAFCTPGGYIYVYTGLIKYLDKADHLAGVMGHEMAHADHRHSTDAMTRQMGVGMLFDFVLGKSDSSAVKQILSNLAALKYSRTNETEADMSSVNYLAATGYACNGTAGFFEKLIADGNNPKIPQFLSTHPNPDNRVAAINEKATQKGCSTAEANLEISYATFKSYFN